MKRRSADFLRSKGYPRKCGSEFVSPLDQQLIKIQTEKDIAYAGALAGYRIGVQEISGNRILVTTAPKLIEAKAGECPTVMALSQEPPQPLRIVTSCRMFSGWLKVAYEFGFGAKSPWPSARTCRSARLG